MVIFGLDFFWLPLILIKSQFFHFFSRPLKGTVSQEFLIIFLLAFSQRYSKDKNFFKKIVCPCSQGLHGQAIFLNFFRYKDFHIFKSLLLRVSTHIFCLTVLLKFVRSLHSFCIFSSFADKVFAQPFKGTVSQDFQHFWASNEQAKTVS